MRQNARFTYGWSARQLLRSPGALVVVQPPSTRVYGITDELSLVVHQVSISSLAAVNSKAAAIGDRFQGLGQSGCDALEVG